MRIFASWSGDESKQIAELLKSWIPCVIQDAEVYVSSQDIGKGERWLASVSNNLSEIDFGIIVVTKTNVNAPWILFEAGALSKSVKGIVVPLLCGIDNFEAAKSPLTQFQYARPVQSEMRDLLLQVNSFCSKPLDQTRIEAALSKWWPDFVSKYEQIELPEVKVPKKETDSSRLQNIEDALGQMMFEMRRMRNVQETLGNARVTAEAIAESAITMTDEARRRSEFMRRRREAQRAEAHRRLPDTQSE